jgi:hypothetical protein
VTDLAERLRLFEPLLDELAAVFCPEAAGPMMTWPGGSVLDAHGRCNIKRRRIGEACASHHEAVVDHADEIMHAIAHDHCPSGNRQLVEPLVAALGARQVMERILGYLETGSAAERRGAVMAWYWATSTLQYSTMDELRNDPGRSASGPVKVVLIPGMPTPTSGNAQVHMLMREFRPRFRDGCLRAFLASDDPSHCRRFSQHFSLTLDDYPVELHPDVEEARRIAEQHPDRWKQGKLGG